jgi:beta-N-acetylhexosaminidase
MLQALVVGGFAAALAACGVRSTPSAAPSPVSPSPVSGGSPTSAPSTSPASASTGPSPTTPPTAIPSADPAALRRKIGRMFLVGFRGMEIGPGDPITTALAGGLGGLILFDRDQTTGGPRNIASPRQLATLTAGLRAAASGPLLIAIDQEGGKVARLSPRDGFPATRSEAAIGATGDPSRALAAGRSMGATMAAAGIDLDLAPVVDINVNPKNPAIGALDRSFSADADVVIAMAEAEIRGLHERGILAAIKHFPGMGSARANSDFAPVDVTATWTKAELAPFRTLIDAGLPDLIMSANILNGQLDPKAPASLSSATVDSLLRGQLGWTGPVVTDDLSAVAITSRFTQKEAIVMAIDAGNDLLTFCNQATYVPDLARQLVDTVVGLVGSGRITEARIDASIARLDALAAKQPA